jgi:hypothetical protein
MLYLFYPLAYEVAKGYSNATVLKRIWNPIDIQGHMSKVKVTGSNFYRITSL